MNDIDNKKLAYIKALEESLQKQNKKLSKEIVKQIVDDAFKLGEEQFWEDVKKAVSTHRKLNVKEAT